MTKGIKAINLRILKLGFTCRSDSGGKILAFSARVFPVTDKEKEWKTMSLPKKNVALIYMTYDS